MQIVRGTGVAGIILVSLAAQPGLAADVPAGGSPPEHASISQAPQAVIESLDAVRKPCAQWLGNLPADAKGKSHVNSPEEELCRYVLDGSGQDLLMFWDGLEFGVLLLLPLLLGVIFYAVELAPRWPRRPARRKNALGF